MPLLVGKFMLDGGFCQQAPDVLHFGVRAAGGHLFIMCVSEKKKTQVRTSQTFELHHPTHSSTTESTPFQTMLYTVTTTSINPTTSLALLNFHAKDERPPEETTPVAAGSLLNPEGDHIVFLDPDGGI